MFDLKYWFNCGRLNEGNFYPKKYIQVNLKKKNSVY